MSDCLANGMRRMCRNEVIGNSPTPLADINRALPGTAFRIPTSADDAPDFTMSAVDAIVVRGTGQWAGMDAVPFFGGPKSHS